MSKKVLILSGSPRNGGNSDILCDEFAKGATEAGHNVEKIHVSEKNIHPCIACYHCSKNSGACVFKDDMAEILQKMIDADGLVNYVNSKKQGIKNGKGKIKAILASPKA